MKIFTILRNIVNGIKTSFARLTSLETWQGDVADYIVAHGTATASDGSTWIYEKWASGIAKCWGKKVENTGQYVTMGSGQGMWWLYYVDIYFPFTFTEIPLAFPDSTVGTAPTLTTILDSTITTTYARVYSGIHNTSGYLDNFIRIQVIGKWK